MDIPGKSLLKQKVFFENQKISRFYLDYLVKNEKHMKLV